MYSGDNYGELSPEYVLCTPVITHMGITKNILVRVGRPTPKIKQTMNINVFLYIASVMAKLIGWPITLAILVLGLTAYYLVTYRRIWLDAKFLIVVFNSIIFLKGLYFLVYMGYMQIFKAGDLLPAINSSGCYGAVTPIVEHPTILKAEENKEHPFFNYNPPEMQDVELRPGQEHYADFVPLKPEHFGFRADGGTVSAELCWTGTPNTFITERYHFINYYRLKSHRVAF